MNEPQETSSGTSALEVIISRSADIIASVGGIAISSVLNDPTVALIGVPLLAGALEAGALETLHRYLSQRQIKRAGTMLYFATQVANRRTNEGKSIRTDGFFEEQPDDRSTAEEIIEASIIASQNDHAEKKLKLYGTLIANITFRTDIDRPLANQLINHLRQLSYRQLCFISLLLTHRGILSQTVRGARRSKDDELIQAAIKLEIYDLIHRGIIQSSISSGFQPEYLEFHYLHPTKAGFILVELTELKEIMLADKEKLLPALPRHVGG